ncbi:MULTISPECIES: UxaA family hydrolase [Rhodococcus]|jgi:(2R)-sulfolactate sulfo-lyase subunit alpha|uniref:UxaA family hydrolase n=1 Tax=Rhodococcus TaxID=1827 RepID=UPI001980EA81|nr:MULTISPECIES: UxaA family hydrolase [Rhodococcus]MDV7089742.1 UxaA family hydrolase [Rhodococcus opacus]QSE86758.1 UxaA family hydrolase [Rhodococcus koreensis]
MKDATRAPDFLAHHDGDVVAVAVRDLDPGAVEGGYLRGPASVSLELLDPIPLGHKVALVDLEAGQDVIEYGLRVGVTTEKITRGSYVHVHNIRSARWHNSIA